MNCEGVKEEKAMQTPPPPLPPPSSQARLNVSTLSPRVSKQRKGAREEHCFAGGIESHVFDKS